MGYSLLSQFQGSLLGVSLGLYSPYFTQWQDNPLNAAVLPHHVLNLILQGVNLLVHQQPISWEGWCQVGQTDDHLKLNQNEISDSSLQSGSLVAIATLPVMLFFHENPDRLRQHLQETAQLWQGKLSDPTLSSNDTVLEQLALGEAMAYLLKPCSNLQELIPQLLSQIPAETQLAQQLTQADLLWQQGASLETAIHRLIPHSTPCLELSCSLAIAIYCFLSTPNAFSISVRRAMRFHPNCHLICAITAALSGTYNGLPGIPIPWRLKLRRLAQLTSNSLSQPPSEHWISIDQHILHQSTQLFQAWAGFYSLTTPDANPLTSLIVAAPRPLSN